MTGIDIIFISECLWDYVYKLFSMIVNQTYHEKISYKTI